MDWNYHMQFLKTVTHFQQVVADFARVSRWGFCSEEDLNNTPVGKSCRNNCNS
jgi:hypothetical protein